MAVQYLFLAWLLLLSAACQAKPEQVMFIYSGNLDGELEPCGCTEQGDLGGILRRATTLEALRQKHPGAFVISAGGLLKSEHPRDRLKNEYILKGFDFMQYDAVGLQWQDLVYGSEFLKSPRLPWVASNWDGDEFPAHHRIEKGGIKLAMFTWLDPEASPFRKMKATVTKVNENTQVVAEAVRKADAEGVLTVVTTAMPLARAKAVMPMKHVDILFIKANYEEYGEPQQVDGTLVLQPGSRGMRLGKLLLQVDSGGKIKSWQHEIVPMPDTVKDHPDLAAWYEEYNEKVKAAYLERVKIRRAQREGKSPYAGAEACQSCHQADYEAWQNSKHAKAFSVLEAVGKAYDPDCIVCHTVGFNREGGFVDTQSTADLINVQCESCHGAAREHGESGGQKPVGHHDWSNSRICEQCHNRAHSPGFKFDSYWPKITHGKAKGG